MLKVSRQYWEAISHKIAWGHWFALFNIIFAILIGARYAFISDWPDTFIGRFYFIINILGHFSFIVFALYLLVLFPLSFLIKNPTTFRGISVIFATIGLTLLLFDSEVFYRFNLHLSILIWDILVNPDNGRLARNWEIFFAPMPFILMVSMIFSRWSWEKLRSLERQKWVKGVVFVLTLCFICSHLIYAWADAYFYRPVTAQRANLPLAYPMTARTFLQKNQLLDKEIYFDRLSQTGRLDAPALDYPKTALHYAPTQQMPLQNILLVNISGLRFDALQSGTMPTLHDFAEQHIQLTNNYSGSNEQDGALLSLFYGLNANYLDSVLNQKIQPVWFDRMHDLGYQFGAFANASSTLYKNTLFGNALNVIHDDDKRTHAWLNWLHAYKQAQTPWFSYVQFDLISAMKNVLNASEDKKEAEYARQLQRIDGYLAQMLAQINQSAPDTVVIITADQGYSFNAKFQQDSNYFGQDRIQVPLVMQWRGHGSGHYASITSLMDIVPSVMQDVFAIENRNGDYTQGRNLFSADNASWVFASNQRWNVIIARDGTQYQLDSKGEYFQFDAQHRLMPSEKPPLELFLQVFNRDRNFLAR
ncbi:DUF3413 domain-containing protein [Pasteurellaceae bacterium HPA106]|uniref:DUF3413 domain-containing protein n=1 Tax=Spirabiliibacterium pneumoniae TaxID=221400 RepID=UPI001AAC927A|nr:DUF3413 domain-containing protein [Spirabiliibacterium pneumoniae]MBE2895390.1 DUF3413 domain-containing protein [Spirabiliibacterium pneumoniae]